MPPRKNSVLGLAIASATVATAALACGAKPRAAPETSALETTEAAHADETVGESSAASSSASSTGDGDAAVRDRACPGGMVLVEGAYCPSVRQACKRWLDPETSPYHDFRCAEYAPSVCLAPRVHERFCVDREEYVRGDEALPLAGQSWTSAGAVCASDGKRLCLESEWQFACEGEEMLPYPYGLSRDATACNIDQMHLGKPQAGLRDLRAPVTAYPRCLSPFGVHDMSGNVEEWATRDHGTAPNRSTMKGAWWLPGKNTCRAATLGHGETYAGAQVGVRCCKDAV